MHKTIALLAVTTAISLPSAAAADDDLTGDEILVTAKRIAQDAAIYAGSAKRLSDSLLEDLPTIHPSQALNTVAGVNIQRGSGQEHLTAIRSPVLTGGSGAGSFLYLEDGVPLRAAGFANVNGLFESAIEIAGAAEVFKGPGSVLYGNNAIHGLINVISDAPSDELSGYADVLVNTDGYLSAKGSVSSPAPGGAFRISTLAVRDNGFRADSGFEQQKVQLRYDGQLGGWDISALGSFTNLNQETAGFIEGPDAFLDEELAASNPNPEAFRDGTAARLHVRLDRPAAGGVVTLIPYARSVDLEFLRHFVPGAALETNSHDSIGILSSYAGSAKGIDYVFGVDGELTQGRLKEFQEGPDVFSFVTGEHYDYTVDSAVFSGYAQADIQITNKLLLDIGVRAEQTRYEYETDLAPGLNGRFLVVADRNDTFGVITPKASLSYEINDSHNAYVRVARGARAPQTSDAFSLQTNQEAGEIETETLDSLEVGVKGRIGTWSYALDAYTARKENFFFRDSDGFNVIDGETSHQGVEFSANGEILPGLTLGGFASLARHRYEFDRANDNPSNAITSGDDVDTAPRFTAGASVDYEWADTFSVGMSWSHIGSYFTDPGNTQTYDGHDVLNLSGKWAISETMEFYGRIENLADIAYADRADFAFGNERFFPGRPRTGFFGVRASF